MCLSLLRICFSQWKRISDCKAHKIRNQDFIHIFEYLLICLSLHLLFLICEHFLVNNKTDSERINFEAVLVSIKADPERNNFEPILKQILKELVSRQFWLTGKNNF